MSDTTQGDQELFQEALETPTLEKFENPDLPPEQPEQPEQKPEPKPEPQQPDAMVPSGRFREESEARRRLEREAQDLRARLAAYEVQPRQPQQPQQKVDLFDNPQAFVEQQMRPHLDQMNQQFIMMREMMSADSAVRLYGEENVSGARAALEQGMARHDPNAWATYNRAMSSHDPYGVITRWHMDRATLAEIGGDLESYKNKILEEAMKSPDFQKRVFDAARGQAASSGRQVNQVAQPKVSTLPSLSDMGAVGGDEQQQEPSEQALFRQAVSAKRRRQ